GWSVWAFAIAYSSLPPAGVDPSSAYRRPPEAPQPRARGAGSTGGPAESGSCASAPRPWGWTGNAVRIRGSDTDRTADGANPTRESPVTSPSTPATATPRAVPATMTSWLPADTCDR